VITGRGDGDYVLVGGIVNRLLKLWRGAGEAEAQVHDARAMLCSVIDCTQHVRGNAGAVSVEGLKRHELGLRSNEGNNAGDHGAGSEGRGGSAIKHTRWRLIHHGDAGLIHVTRRSAAVKHTGGGLVDVSALVTAGSVAGKVVALHNPRLEGGMVGIDPSID